MDIYHELSLSDIEAIAIQVRNYWSIGLGPIDNLVSILQKNGIMISIMDLNNKKIDAFSVWYDSIPYIYISKDKYSNARLRFDLAHESGHILIHGNLFNDDDIETKVISERIEREANMFAACFLLPSKTFENDIYSSSINHFIQLKKKWKVSIGAMIYRCQDLELLTPNQIKYLKDFLINYICNTKDDPLLEELYKIPFLSLKLEQYHLKSPDLSLDFFEQFETKILFSFLDEIIKVIQKRRNPKYQQEVLDKVISLIGDPKNIDFELLRKVY